MNLHTSSITIDGKMALLVIAPVNWEKGVRTTHVWHTVAQEHATGLETRRAAAGTALMSIKADLLLKGANAQAWRAAIGGLGDKRIALALPISIYTEAQWADRIFQAERNAGWNRSGDTIVDVDTQVDGVTPDGSYKAALLVGRLQNPQHNAVTPKLLQGQLTLMEESDYGSRIEGIGAVSESFIWAPEWSRSPTEEAKSLLEPLEIRKGREKPMGGEPLDRWEQEAQFQFSAAQFKAFYRFWEARMKDQASFSFASVATPGVETPQAPHAFDGTLNKGKMRFADGKLDCKWITPNRVEVRCAFSQEFASLTAQAMPIRMQLVELWAQVEDEPEGTERYAVWDAPITALSQTWAAMAGKLEVSALRQTLTPESEKVSVKISREDSVIAGMLAKEELEAPVWLKIYDAVKDGETWDTHLRFVGRVGTVEKEQNLLTLEASFYGGAFDKQLPRFYISRPCNHTLFSHACRRRNPVAMAKSEWKWQGTYNDYWSEGKLLLDTIVAPAEVVGAETMQLGYAVGSPSYANAYPPRNAFDGSAVTFYASAEVAAYVGLLLEFGVRVTTVKYRPRVGFESRLNGAKIQGGNADDFSDAVDLHTISGTPSQTLHSVAISGAPLYRCVRILSASGQNCDVAEMEVWGRKVLKPSTLPGGYFAGGWVILGSGLTRQIRQIRDSLNGDGTLDLVINRPFRGDLTDAVFEFYPGCDGQWSTCRAKFDNQLNNGGFPWVPDKVQEAAQGFKGGK